MKRPLALIALAALISCASTVDAQDKIAQARSAGPASISDDATVKDWDGTVLAEGTNGWTCLPDREDTVGVDPWCIDATWGAFLAAYASQTEPNVTTIGVAYMLMGDGEASNDNPYDTEMTLENHWVSGLGAHIMIVGPSDPSTLGISTDHTNGGPWVMWAGTPYAHTMIPIDSYEQ